MRRTWDDLHRLVTDWEAKLGAEGLGVIEVGPSTGGPRATNRKDLVSLTPAIENRVIGSIWELSATVDALVEALQSYRFRDLVDAEICEMLSRRVPWHRIAKTLRCSKRRVSMVSGDLEAWRRQVSDHARASAELDERIGDAREMERARR